MNVDVVFVASAVFVPSTAISQLLTSLFVWLPYLLLLLSFFSLAVLFVVSAVLVASAVLFIMCLLLINLRVASAVVIVASAVSS